MFESVLIANRGEIAVRVIRTARHLGIRTIAVYSDEDAAALHVRLADEAHRIGPAPAAESYLRADRVLEIARATKADAIHPGYGFLSENAKFAAACAEAGVVFIGPPPSAIRAMGLKDAAKTMMEAAGVPVVPGYHGDMQTDSFLKQKAYETGYPLMIKAVAGGGGKGMRRVDRHQDFAEALASCRREAKAAFGDDRVLLERFVTRPRHIEVQVFGDTHGSVLHLFERDCSLQRRHQKVVEEAPAPGVTAALRARMGEAAVAAARAVGYVGAGTVEFIVDAKNGLNENSFYFMEMNTRLQVEHPVTEAITGLDLVELQFCVAAGEPLPFTQESLGEPRGVAVEARLYAEDPVQGFLPQSGELVGLSWPQDQADLRIDSGVAEGGTISAYYDPMIAKLIAWGATREEALVRLSRGLRDTTILGLKTNLAFLDRVANFEPFVSGEFDTGLIEEHAPELIEDMDPDIRRCIAAGLWLAHLKARQVEQDQRLTDESASPWSDMSGWSLDGGRQGRLHLVINGQAVSIDIQWTADGTLLVGERMLEMRQSRMEDGRFHAIIADRAETATARGRGDHIHAQWRGMSLEVKAQDLLDRDSEVAEGASLIRAPMSGRLIKLLVGKGDRVERGARLAVLEAMKMEHPLVAASAAIVASIGASEGEQVTEGQVIAVLETLDQTASRHAMWRM